MRKKGWIGGCLCIGLFCAASCSSKDSTPTGGIGGSGNGETGGTNGTGGNGGAGTTGGSVGTGGKGGTSAGGSGGTTIDGGGATTGSGGTGTGGKGGSGAGGASGGTGGSAGKGGSAGTGGAAGTSGAGGAGTSGAAGKGGSAGTTVDSGSPMDAATDISTPPPISEKPRIVVLTDISNEPDDEESLVRYHVYSNGFDTEGLIATTSRHLRTGPREDLIRRQTAAYAMVRPNLVKHAAGYPEAAALGAVTKTGQTTYGMAAVGPGKNTAGSQQIIDAVDRVDSRPTWISVWGGANTLAQALQDVRATRNASDLASFVAKMRVYTISDQDDAGLWIRTEFPDLFYIVSPGTDYGSATWSGIPGTVRTTTPDVPFRPCR
jgi:hypothetical protein